MPLFKCSQCGALENTALGDYWHRKAMQSKPPKCSECSTGRWHGEFEKTTPEADGYILGSDGFYYTPAELQPGGYFHGRVKPADRHEGNKNEHQPA